MFDVKDIDGQVVGKTTDEVAKKGKIRMRTSFSGRQLEMVEVTSNQPLVGGHYAVKKAYNPKPLTFALLEGNKRREAKQKAQGIANEAGHSLSWRRGLVWVYPDGMQEAYTVDYDLPLEDFYEQIRNIQYNSLVSRKIWESWR